jgi:hypothetical protein
MPEFTLIQPYLAPDCGFRISVEEIRNAYGSAESAFAAGDFITAMLLSSPSDDMHACAVILSGLYEQGLLLLEEYGAKTQRQKLCQTFALWSLDRISDATSILRTLDLSDEKARRLSNIVERERLVAFITAAMLPGPTGAPPSALAPEYQYGRITAKYVASQMAKNAYDYSPADPFDEFILGLPKDERPDFIFALSPQWLLAKNFHKVEVPKVLWNHDTDVFAYRNAANLSLYDVAISAASQDCFELSNVADVFCASNVMPHPAATPYPEARVAREKTVDVVFTGSGLGSLEKSRFLFHLAKLSPQYKIEVVDGVLPEREYFSLLSQAKFLPIVNRYAGAPSPRWREGLTNGACLLYPQGTPFDKIAPGCFSYRPESVTSDIRTHIDRYDARSDPQYDMNNVVPKINASFAIHRQSREAVFERTLKYAAFMGLVWRPPRRQPAEPRRIVWLSPQIDSWCYGAENIRAGVGKIAVSIDDEDLRDENGFNSAAQLNLNIALTFPDNAESSTRFAVAEGYFARGLELFPKSLLLHFNRAQWHFIKPGGNPCSAAAEFEEIIARFFELEFDPHDSQVGINGDRDIVFPYYDYADLVLKRLMRDRGVFPKALPDPRDVLLSACHGYIGWARLKAGDRSGALEKFRKAIAIFAGGLPILRLFSDTLLLDCIEDKRVSSERITEFVGSFFAVANIFPTVILSHAHLIVPILADGKQYDAARELLEGWYRLANVVRGGVWEPSDTTLRLIYRYREFFPEDLTQRLAASRTSINVSPALTPLESNLLRIVHTNSLYRFVRASLLRRRLVGLARPILDPSNITIASLWQAFSVWYHAPLATKWDYILRTAVLLSRKDGTTLERIQMWGASSVWARRQ